MKVVAVLPASDLWVVIDTGAKIPRLRYSHTQIVGWAICDDGSSVPYIATDHAELSLLDPSRVVRTCASASDALNYALDFCREAREKAGEPRKVF